LSHSRNTISAEVLNPANQRVVNLKDLEGPELVFTAISPYRESTTSYCPGEFLRWIRDMNLRTTRMRVVKVYGGRSPDAVISSIVAGVLDRENIEGENLYFLDDACNVLGMITVKTSWYVHARALKEGALSMLKQRKDKPWVEVHVKKMHARLELVGHWLNVEYDTKKKWMERGEEWIRWINEMSNGNKPLKKHQLVNAFPDVWESFLNRP